MFLTLPILKCYVFIAEDSVTVRYKTRRGDQIRKLLHFLILITVSAIDH